MIRIVFSEVSWRYIVTLNNVEYTSCDSPWEAEREAKKLQHDLRYGA